MAWNEPGNGKDPWKREEPNDLDKIVQNWQNRLGRLFGGGARKGPGGSGGYFLVVFALVAWALTGFYRVDEAERGIVQRFGAYQDTTMPGLRWHWPFPIETVNRVNTIAISDYQYQTEMLTADEQYVYIDMVVQYRRSDPFAYRSSIRSRPLRTSPRARCARSSAPAGSRRWSHRADAMRSPLGRSRCFRRR